MLRIYKPIGSEDYELVEAVETTGAEMLGSFDGSPRATAWTPVLVRRAAMHPRGPHKESDFPWFGSDALMMRERAVTALRPLITPGAEILPLATEDGTKLFVLNVTNIVDALDEERSSIVRFPDTNRIMRIKRTVFREPMLHAVDIFRLPLKASATYVSQVFRDAVVAAGLVGLDFTLVWSSNGAS